ncbi:hypothetical protein F5887DRAFT_599659 [Amanita rubescens]|nr:hypothetical protein F5887DRAFT_599659 [Amanita rubescens]
MITDGDVAQSDLAVPEDWRIDLNQAVEGLEDVYPSRRDWHSGSGSSVVSCEGVMLEFCVDEDYRPPQKFVGHPSRGWLNMKSTFSRKFQWLPCNIENPRDVARVALTVCGHEGLYHIIERIVGRVIVYIDSRHIDDTTGGSKMSLVATEEARHLERRNTTRQADHVPKYPSSDSPIPLGLVTEEIFWLSLSLILV